MSGSRAFLSGGLDSSIITVLAKRANPEMDAYTIRFREQDQRLEAMPDDVIYARKVADKFGIPLHEIEIAPDIVDLLPRMVDILDEPIGDPAAINTLLMCEAARTAGVKVLLSGMGADELFGGYRKHLACVMAARYQKAPKVLRHGLERGVDALPVTARGRGLRYARWAKRFLTFAELPEEEAFRRSYTLYDPPDLARSAEPGSRRLRHRDRRRAPRDLLRHGAWRPREPDVPRGLEDVPSGTQPDLHGSRRAWPRRPKFGSLSSTRWS